jgi:hypothetical protein
VLLVREFRDDHTQSTMKTLENEVFVEGTWGKVTENLPIAWNTVEQAYIYPNGSEIVIKGLRDSRGIYSQQYDHVFVNEAGSLNEKDYDQLIRAKRNAKDDFSLLITDLNPEYDLFWLHVRCDDGDTTEVVTTHADNPHATATYIMDLSKMRDTTARDRLYLGKRQAAVQGAYYAKQLAEAKESDPCRITTVLPQKGMPVHVCYDLGRSDYTAIWLFQIVAGEWRWIDYYESSMEELDHYASMLAVMALQGGFTYGIHCLPHDAAHKRLGMGGKSIEEQLWELGITRTLVVPNTRIQAQHNEVREVLSRSWFDNSRWEKPELSQVSRRGVRFGLQRLQAYKAAADDRLSVLKPTPEHDMASHGASAFAVGCLANPVNDGARSEQEARGVDYLGTERYDSPDGTYRREYGDERQERQEHRW